jgi:HPt (histidine-containing phosphotransfer) domain-containing protein
MNTLEATNASHLPIFDKDALIAIYGDEKELYLEVIQLFLDEIPPSMQHIQSAIQAQDGEALNQHAHALKGMAGAIKGKRASYWAFELERKGKENNFTDCEKILRQLETELELLHQDLLHFKRDLMENGC